MECIFCKKYNFNIICENNLAYAIYDKYPVNKGHILVIPNRHVDNFFYLNDNEIKAIFNLLKKTKSILNNKYNTDAYNIGINIGKYAGQTINHVHIHLIPRYKGDIDNPAGGVRKLIKELVPYDG